MRYYLNEETKIVATLEDGEQTASLPGGPLAWKPVHLHAGEGPSHLKPSRAGVVIGRAIGIVVTLALISAVVGLAVLVWTAVLR